MVKKNLRNILFLPLLFFCLKSYPQETGTVIHKIPSVAISSNLLYDLTTSMNLGIEFKLNSFSTLKLPVTYNPWAFENNKKFKFILFQPEWRWWMCEAFSGHFFGLHAHYSYYNVGSVNKILSVSLSDYMKNQRFQGYLVGGGLTYGYQFYLAPRWSLEVSLGIGYAYLDYGTYYCEECGKFIKHDSKNYAGLTQAGISLIYFLK
ncbi:MAG: DUF3575 domain-containing protein [Dysgonamonadaceae bacterium]|jgi:hypothetical protein|nr:DUF3575 domain-containing protein [Dysgonamonadaceae bacterium]